jgi:hypothetical protein
MIINFLFINIFEMSLEFFEKALSGADTCYLIIFFYI